MGSEVQSMCAGLPAKTKASAKRRDPIADRVETSIWILTVLVVLAAAAQVAGELAARGAESQSPSHGVDWHSRV